ncbi:MAG: site-specific integrase [Syntrophomonadaceae bacterium]|nr:site-specific integrase [Syntrophomonadaceae bacterium]
MAIRAGIEARVIPQDALLGLGTVKVPRKDRLVLTRHDLYRIIKASEHYLYGLVIRLLVVTGARLGEILGLTWDRVDFAKNTITIDRTVDVLSRCRKDDTKTPNSRRTVILDAETMTKLSEWKKKSHDKVVFMQNRELVFKSPAGKPLHYGRVHKMFKAILKKAELPDMRIHDIRHAVVTLLLAEGVPAVTVASLVGHNVATTNAVYAEKIKISQGLNFVSESQKE